MNLLLLRTNIWNNNRCLRSMRLQYSAFRFAAYLCFIKGKNPEYHVWSYLWFFFLNNVVSAGSFIVSLFIDLGCPSDLGKRSACYVIILQEDIFHLKRTSVYKISPKNNTWTKKRLAVMLAVKRSVGVALEVNLRNLLHATDRRRQKSKIGVSVPPQKWLMSPHHPPPKKIPKFC